MASKKNALRKAMVKPYHKRNHQPVNVYNVYIENFEVNEPPKEKNLMEKILTLGMTLIRMLVMWLA